MNEATKALDALNDAAVAMARAAMTHDVGIYKLKVEIYLDRYKDLFILLKDKP